MTFNFGGRSFVAGDRLKLPSATAVPPSAGLIGLCRPTATSLFSAGFYAPGGTGGWLLGRAPSTDRLGLYRPLRAPAVLQSVSLSATTVTTPAFVPPTYCTLLAFSAVRRTGSNPAASALTDSLSGSWTLITGADRSEDDTGAGGTAFLRLRCHYLQIGATAASMTVSSSSTLAVQHGLVIVAVEGAGSDWSNVGVSSGTAGAATATLSSAPSAAGSFVVGAFYDRNFTSPITPPSGYAQLGLFNVGTNGKLQIVQANNTSGAALAWNQAGDNVVIAMALEAKQPPLVEHSSAAWVDGKAQSFLAFSASNSEHYLALNDAGSLQSFSSTIAIDSTSAVALGAFDLALPRGGFSGEYFWLGVLRAMPPLGPLDQVLRGLQPPTILRPWLAHLFPLMGRPTERCVFTNIALNVDSGTTLANVATPQPQLQLEEGPFEVPVGVSRRRVRVTARNATGNTVLTLDAGPSNQVAALVVSLPAPGATTGLGVAYNGGALTTSTLPSAAAAQQGDLFVGTSILDGAPQSEAGNVRLGALAIGPVWSSGVHSALWAIASSYLRPMVNPIALVGESGTAYVEDLSARITDPARAGYSFALGSISGGLTATISGNNLNWQAASVGHYGAVLTITSLLTGLAPAVQVTISFAVGIVVARYPNGYQWRATLRMPPWPGGGLEPTHLLPFAELGQRWRTTGSGGLVESAVGRDIRFETTAGVQIAHRLLAYDGTGGRAPVLLNFSRELRNVEEIHVYLGKPDLLQSEENTALARSGGWVAWHSGWDLQDLSNLGHTLNASGTIAQTSIGSWSAGLFNGSSSYRFRISNELNAQPGFFVACLVQSSEAVGRGQEVLNIAPGDVAQLAMRLSSQGYWVTVTDVGGQLLSVSSDTGLYTAGEPHALGAYWDSGKAPGMVLDGRLVEPSATVPVATGLTAMNETLEIGRGNRPAGTASYWNGGIGPVLMSTAAQSQQQCEVITAALKEPRLVYGLSDFQGADDITAPFIAMPLQGTATRGAATAFDVVANAYNPGVAALTVSVPVVPANVAVSVIGNSVLVNPSTNAALRVLVPYLLSSSNLSSSGVIDVAVGAAPGGGPGPGPDPIDDGTLPAGFPAVPTFSGPIVNVSSAAQLNAAIAASVPGDNRIRCAGGVNYGSVTINRPISHRFEIICTTPRFTGLDTTQRPDLKLTSELDRNARLKVVIGDADPNVANNGDSPITSGISVQPVAFGVLWLEGFDCRREQGIARIGQVIGDIWVRKCRLGIRASVQIAGGGSGGTASGTMGRVICWETWHYSDGTIPGTDPQPQANYTDYAIRAYNSPGIYMYKCFLEGGISHYVSAKMNVDDIRIYNCIFMPWSDRKPSEINNIQLGQEGSKNGLDRTCGYARIVGNTFGGWDGHTTYSHHIVSFQDCAGMLFEGNMVYPEVKSIWRALGNSNTGLDANDIGPVFAGRLGIRTINNNLIGRPAVLVSNALYDGSWAGGELYFENNTRSGTTNIPIGTRNGGWPAPTFGPNPGYG